MLLNAVPDPIRPALDDLIDTLIGYGFAFDDDQSAQEDRSIKLAFTKATQVYTLMVVDSGHALWLLFADGFIARAIIDKVMADFEGADQACMVDSVWLDDFR